MPKIRSKLEFYNLAHISCSKVNLLLELLHFWITIYACNVKKHWKLEASTQR